MPAYATAAPVNKAVAAMDTARRRSTFTPECCAARSPNARTSSEEAITKHATKPIRITGHTLATAFHVEPFSEPICQNTI
ncbi:Uncharacterised protein [Mycobacterium tuberculosis]|nr:Uncharacterised protein [Mycobacterium tuberculosis]